MWSQMTVGLAGVPCEMFGPRLIAHIEPGPPSSIHPSDQNHISFQKPAYNMTTPSSSNLVLHKSSYIEYLMSQKSNFSFNFSGSNPLLIAQVYDTMTKKTMEVVSKYPKRIVVAKYPFMVAVGGNGAQQFQRFPFSASPYSSHHLFSSSSSSPSLSPSSSSSSSLASSSSSSSNVVWIREKVESDSNSEVLELFKFDYSIGDFTHFILPLNFKRGTTLGLICNDSGVFLLTKKKIFFLSFHDLTSSKPIGRLTSILWASRKSLIESIHHSPVYDCNVFYHPRLCKSKGSTLVLANAYHMKIWTWSSRKVPLPSLSLHSSPNDHQSTTGAASHLFMEEPLIVSTPGSFATCRVDVSFVQQEPIVDIAISDDGNIVVVQTTTTFYFWRSDFQPIDEPVSVNVAKNMGNNSSRSDSSNNFKSSSGSNTNPKDFSSSNSRSSDRPTSTSKTTKEIPFDSTQNGSKYLTLFDLFLDGDTLIKEDKYGEVELFDNCLVVRNRVISANPSTLQCSRIILLENNRLILGHVDKMVIFNILPKALYESSPSVQNSHVADLRIVMQRKNVGFLVSHILVPSTFIPTYFRRSSFTAVIPIDSASLVTINDQGAMAFWNFNDRSYPLIHHSRIPLVGFLQGKYDLAQNQLKFLTFNKGSIILKTAQLESIPSITLQSTQKHSFGDMHLLYKTNNLDEHNSFFRDDFHASTLASPSLNPSHYSTNSSKFNLALNYSHNSSPPPGPTTNQISPPHSPGPHSYQINQSQAPLLDGDWNDLVKTPVLHSNFYWTRNHENEFWSLRYFKLRPHILYLYSHEFSTNNLGAIVLLPTLRIIRSPSNPLIFTLSSDGFSGFSHSLSSSTSSSILNLSNSINSGSITNSRPYRIDFMASTINECEELIQHLFQQISSTISISSAWTIPYLNCIHKDIISPKKHFVPQAGLEFGARGFLMNFLPIWLKKHTPDSSERPTMEYFILTLLDHPNIIPLLGLYHLKTDPQVASHELSRLGFGDRNVYSDDRRNVLVQYFTNDHQLKLLPLCFDSMAGTYEYQDGRIDQLQLVSETHGPFMVFPRVAAHLETIIHKLGLTSSTLTATSMVTTEPISTQTGSAHLNSSGQSYSIVQQQQQKNHTILAQAQQNSNSSSSQDIPANSSESLTSHRQQQQHQQQQSHTIQASTQFQGEFNFSHPPQFTHRHRSLSDSSQSFGASDALSESEQYISHQNKVATTTTITGGQHTMMQSHHPYGFNPAQNRNHPSRNSIPRRSTSIITSQIPQHHHLSSLDINTSAAAAESESEKTLEDASSASTDEISFHDSEVMSDATVESDYQDPTSFHTNPSSTLYPNRNPYLNQRGFSTISQLSNSSFDSGHPSLSRQHSTYSSDSNKSTSTAAASAVLADVEIPPVYRGSIPWHCVVKILLDIAHAIKSLHTFELNGNTNPIAHGDIKLENILVDFKTFSGFLKGDFQVYLADFEHATFTENIYGGSKHPFNPNSSGSMTMMMMRVNGNKNVFQAGVGGNADMRYSDPDPHCSHLGHDIYCFGLVALQLITLKSISHHHYNHNNHDNTTSSSNSSINNNNINNISSNNSNNLQSSNSSSSIEIDLDPVSTLRKHVNSEYITDMTDKWCSNRSIDRPNIHQVINDLNDLATKLVMHGKYQTLAPPKNSDAQSLFPQSLPNSMSPSSSPSNANSITTSLDQSAASQLSSQATFSSSSLPSPSHPPLATPNSPSSSNNIANSSTTTPVVEMQLKETRSKSPARSSSPRTQSHYKFKSFFAHDFVWNAILNCFTHWFPSGYKIRIFHGDNGTGKTMLLKATKKLAHLHGYSRVYTRCDSGRSVAFGCLLNALKTMFINDCDQSLQHIELTLPHDHDLSNLIKYCQNSKSYTLQAQGGTAPSPPPLVSWKSIQLLFKYICSLLQTPLILLIDDIHHLDSSTRSILHLLLAERHLYVIATALSSSGQTNLSSILSSQLESINENDSNPNMKYPNTKNESNKHAIKSNSSVSDSLASSRSFMDESVDESSFRSISTSSAIGYEASFMTQASSKSRNPQSSITGQRLSSSSPSFGNKSSSHSGDKKHKSKGSSTSNSSVPSANAHEIYGRDASLARSRDGKLLVFSWISSKQSHSSSNSKRSSRGRKQGQAQSVARSSSLTSVGGASSDSSEASFSDSYSNNAGGAKSSSSFFKDSGSSSGNSTPRSISSLHSSSSGSMNYPHHSNQHDTYGYESDEGGCSDNDGFFQSDYDFCHSNPKLPLELLELGNWTVESVWEIIQMRVKFEKMTSSTSEKWKKVTFEILELVGTLPCNVIAFLDDLPDLTSFGWDMVNKQPSESLYLMARPGESYKTAWDNLSSEFKSKLVISSFLDYEFTLNDIHSIFNLFSTNCKKGLPWIDKERGTSLKQKWNWDSKTSQYLLSLFIKTDDSHTHKKTKSNHTYQNNDNFVSVSSSMISVASSNSSSSNSSNPSSTKSPSIPTWAKYRVVNQEVKLFLRSKLVEESHQEMKKDMSYIFQNFLPKTEDHLFQLNLWELSFGMKLPHGSDLDLRYILSLISAAAISSGTSNHVPLLNHAASFLCSPNSLKPLLEDTPLVLLTLCAQLEECGSNLYALNLIQLTINVLTSNSSIFKIISRTHPSFIREIHLCQIRLISGMLDDPQRFKTGVKEIWQRLKLIANLEAQGSRNTTSPLESSSITSVTPKTLANPHFPAPLERETSDSNLQSPSSSSSPSPSNSSSINEKAKKSKSAPKFKNILSILNHLESYLIDGNSPQQQSQQTQTGFITDSYPIEFLEDIILSIKNHMYPSISSSSSATSSNDPQSSVSISQAHHPPRLKRIKSNPFVQESFELTSMFILQCSTKSCEYKQTKILQNLSLVYLYFLFTYELYTCPFTLTNVACSFLHHSSSIALTLFSMAWSIFCDPKFASLFHPPSHSSSQNSFHSDDRSQTNESDNEFEKQVIEQFSLAENQEISSKLIFSKIDSLLTLAYYFLYRYQPMYSSLQVLETASRLAKSTGNLNLIGNVFIEYSKFLVFFCVPLDYSMVVMNEMIKWSSKCHFQNSQVIEGFGNCLKLLQTPSSLASLQYQPNNYLNLISSFSSSPNSIENFTFSNVEEFNFHVVQDLAFAHVMNVLGQTEQSLYYLIKAKESSNFSSLGSSHHHNDKQKSKSAKTNLTSNLQASNSTPIITSSYSSGVSLIISTMICNISTLAKLGRQQFAGKKLKLTSIFQKHSGLVLSNLCDQPLVQPSSANFTNVSSSSATNPSSDFETILKNSQNLAIQKLLPLCSSIDHHTKFISDFIGKSCSKMVLILKYLRKVDLFNSKKLEHSNLKRSNSDSWKDGISSLLPMALNSLYSSTSSSSLKHLAALSGELLLQFGVSSTSMSEPQIHLISTSVCAIYASLGYMTKLRLLEGHSNYCSVFAFHSNQGFNFSNSQASLAPISRYSRYFNSMKSEATLLSTGRPTMEDLWNKSHIGKFSKYFPPFSQPTISASFPLLMPSKCHLNPMDYIRYFTNLIRYNPQSSNSLNQMVSDLLDVLESRPITSSSNHMDDIIPPPVIYNVEQLQIISQLFKPSLEYEIENFTNDDVFAAHLSREAFLQLIFWTIFAYTEYLDRNVKNGRFESRQSLKEIHLSFATRELPSSAPISNPRMIIPINHLQGNVINHQTIQPMNTKVIQMTLRNFDFEESNLKAMNHRSQINPSNKLFGPLPEHLSMFFEPLMPYIQKVDPVFEYLDSEYSAEAHPPHQHRSQSHHHHHHHNHQNHHSKNPCHDSGGKALRVSWKCFTPSQAKEPETFLIVGTFDKRNTLVTSISKQFPGASFQFLQELHHIWALPLTSFSHILIHESANDQNSGQLYSITHAHRSRNPFTTYVFISEHEIFQSNDQRSPFHITSTRLNVVQKLKPKNHVTPLLPPNDK